MKQEIFSSSLFMAEKVSISKPDDHFPRWLKLLKDLRLQTEIKKKKLKLHNFIAVVTEKVLFVKQCLPESVQHVDYLKLGFLLCA